MQPDGSVVVQAGGRQAGARPGRVLVVDDNDVVREVLQDFLSPTYHVDGASSVAAALKALTEQPPDVILLDLKMPGTDGMTLLKSLRQKGVATPVIIMTGYGSPGSADEARRYGVTAYLGKPFDLRQLEQLVAGSIRRA